MTTPQNMELPLACDPVMEFDPQDRRFDWPMPKGAVAWPAEVSRGTLRERLEAFLFEVGW